MDIDLVKLTFCAEHQEMLKEIMKCEECRKLRESFADKLRVSVLEKIKNDLAREIEGKS